MKVTSIKNTTETHIVIQAEAAKYEQLGFFRAVLSTEGTLKNVKSTSGSNRCYFNKCNFNSRTKR